MTRRATFRTDIGRRVAYTLIVVCGSWVLVGLGFVVGVAFMGGRVL